MKLLVMLFLQAPITSSLLGPNMKNCWINEYKYLTVRVKTTNAWTYVSVNINHSSCVYVSITYTLSPSVPVCIPFH